jgi:hypothetical protein
MEPVEHSYKVNICGETFQVKSDQPPQTIERVAGYLDFKIRELGKGGINVDKFRVVVLAAPRSRNTIASRTRSKRKRGRSMRAWTGP